jgi:hypothetical protein
MASFPLLNPEHREGKDAMKFIALYHDQIQGVISGLDRVRFVGSDRTIGTNTGLKKVLWCVGGGGYAACAAAM